MKIFPTKKPEVTLGTEVHLGKNKIFSQLNCNVHYLSELYRQALVGRQPPRVIRGWWVIYFDLLLKRY